MITSFRNVEYEGTKYNISFRDYAYSYHKCIVNEEESDFIIPNDKMRNVDVLKTVLIKAIKEYEERHTAQQAIKEWDGKL